MKKQARQLIGAGALAGSLLVTISLQTGAHGAALPQGAASAAIRQIPVVQPPPSETQLEAFRSKIQHIVFVIKENRSFDTYFGTFPGADGVNNGLISTGERMALRRA